MEGGEEKPISQKASLVQTPRELEEASACSGTAALGDSPGEAFGLMHRAAASYECPGEAGKSWRKAPAGGIWGGSGREACRAVEGSGSL